jgi:simple sugar transport system ATP-binding protein
MTVMENLALGNLDATTKRGIVSKRQMARRARQLIREFAVAAPNVHAPMWSLSGGNQQRVVLARELSHSPNVLVAAQPTRGLDVGAMEDMWARLRTIARDGTAVLLISTELDEIVALADRIVVIQRGQIVGEMTREEVDPERLGLLMGGQTA